MRKNLEMNKLLLLLIFTFVFSPSFGQNDCNYKLNVDTDEEVFKLTHEELAEFMMGKDQNVFIYFSLMKEGDIKSMVLQISVNAKEPPPILCFDRNSRVSFRLQDGSYSSLRYLGEVNCGRQTKNEKALDNSTSEAAFLLDKDNLERLRNTPIESMRITTMKTNFDIEFQNVISNSEIIEPIYPKEFFVKNLSCLD